MHSKLIGYILWIFGFMGAHRFYYGKPVTGKDLRAAIDAVLADRPVSQDQRPATGCNIKWKPGNEPSYFG